MPGSDDDTAIVTAISNTHSRDFIKRCWEYLRKERTTNDCVEDAEEGEASSAREVTA